MTDFTITVKLDIKKDAWNYRWALNSNTHSSSRKEQIENISDFDFNQLLGLQYEDTYPLMKNYLEYFWKEHKEEAEQKIQEMQIKLDQIKDDVFEKMTKLTKQAIYRNNFTIYLTSLNRWPYNYKEWYSLTFIFRKSYITPFIHELLHFQTIHYYKSHIMSKLHDEKKFETLKEAVTFLLNYEFNTIMDGYDNGYPQHQELRKQLESYRLSQAEDKRDFAQLIDYACDILLS